jgi:hypothetical protein
MNRKLLILSVAAVAVAATGAYAKTHHHHASQAQSGGKYAAPAQPIPYTELDSYVGGSRHAQKSAAPMSTPATTEATPSSPSTPAGATPAPQ